MVGDIIPIPEYRRRVSISRFFYVVRRGPTEVAPQPSALTWLALLMAISAVELARQLLALTLSFACETD